MLAASAGALMLPDSLSNMRPTMSVVLTPSVRLMVLKRPAAVSYTHLTLPTIE